MRVNARSMLKSGLRGFLSRCVRNHLKAEISEKARNEVCKLTDCAIRYKVDFQAGERQCVKRPAGFTADGRADRISSRFDRICSFFCAYRLEKGSVSSTRIFAKSVCQPYARFRKTGGFFACLRAFPVCQAYTPKKSISLQPRGECLYQVNHGLVHHEPPM